MFNVVEIMNDLRKDLEQFRREFSEVYGRSVRQTFEDHTHHFPITLWGYLMAAFARVAFIRDCGLAMTNRRLDA